VEEETKNEASQRLTPVHSTLLRLGLEGRVAELRSAGETHLFPGWYKAAHAMLTAEDGRDVNQPYSQFLPRWFNRTYLPKVGIHDERKVFHSFRHTLKTALARAGVPRSVSDEITGHDDRTSGARYVHETSVESMKDALEKIHFDGLGL
jgi:integrase